MREEMEEGLAGDFYQKAELFICSHLVGIAVAESEMKIANL